MQTNIYYSSSHIFVFEDPSCFFFFPEVEIEPPPPRRRQGAGGASAGGAGGGPGGGQPASAGGAKGIQGGMIGPSSRGQPGVPGMAMGSGQTGPMSGGGGAMPAPMGTVPPGIVAQTGRSPMSMMSMASIVGSPSMAPPGFEAPCKCEVECCQMPAEPRRPLPILHLPMVFHYGCCGCVDCPPSLNPFIAFRIRYTMMMARSMGRRPILNSEGELPEA